MHGLKTHTALVLVTDVLSHTSINQHNKFEKNVEPVSSIDEIKEKTCLSTGRWWNTLLRRFEPSVLPVVTQVTN